MSRSGDSSTARMSRAATGVMLLAVTGCATVTVHPATPTGTTGASTGASAAVSVAPGSAQRPATRPSSAPMAPTKPSATARTALSDAGLDGLVDPDASGFRAVQNATFVVAGQVSPARLQEVLRIATADDSAIADHATARPKSPLVVLLSKDVDQFAEWTGSDDVEHLDGVTVPGNRFDRPYVVLAPDLWSADVDTDYRRYLLVHELTHAYSDPREDAAVWPVEGYAEYVAMQVTGNDYRDDPPSSAHLPTAAEFRSDDPEVAGGAYFLASDFLEYLGQQYGEDEVRTFYRKVLTTNVDDAFSAAFATKLSTAEAAWKKNFLEVYR